MCVYRFDEFVSSKLNESSSNEMSLDVKKFNAKEIAEFIINSSMSPNIRMGSTVRFYDKYDIIKWDEGGFLDFCGIGTFRDPKRKEEKIEYLTREIDALPDDFKKNLIRVDFSKDCVVSYVFKPAFEKKLQKEYDEELERRFPKQKEPVYEYPELYEKVVTFKNKQEMYDSILADVVKGGSCVVRFVDGEYHQPQQGKEVFYIQSRHEEFAKKEIEKLDKIITSKYNKVTWCRVHAKGYAQILYCDVKESKKMINNILDFISYMDRGGWTIGD